MAGHVTKKLLVKPEVDPILLEGATLWKWEEGDIPQKLVFKADKDGFFLFAKGDENSKAYDSYIWDFALVSDVRNGKPPKDTKMQETLTALISSDTLEDYGLTLVYRRDGIVNVDYINLVCEWPDTADKFKRAVNALTFNMLNANAAPCVLQRKSYVKILVHANNNGQIYLKYIHKVLMLKNKQDIDDVNQLLASFNLVKETEDGTSYTTEEKFTEEIFLRVVDRLLHSRTDDIDVLLDSLSKKSKLKHTIALDDFHKFLNHEQRDPRLNEILFPMLSRSQAKARIFEHEAGKSDDRLTSKGLMSYLMSEENNILDLEHLSQHHDMNHHITHYFINSSHNTYLTGHQLRSSSTSEMYIQCLLLGCRCVELDCWPSNDGDDIIITHGGTLCGRVSFKEVVEAINEFAFVTSDYPVILSIENHCKSKPLLIQKMANIFTTTFGDKLVSGPLEGFPLESGVPLPSPEVLRGKILLKDKIRRQKDMSTNTLPRGTHLPSDVPEGLATVPEENKATPVQNGAKEEGNGQNGSATQKTPAEGEGSGGAEEGGLGPEATVVAEAETKKEGENGSADKAGDEQKPPEGSEEKAPEEKPPEAAAEEAPVFGKSKSVRSTSLAPSEESMTSLSSTPVHKKVSGGTAEQLGIKDLEKMYKTKGRSEADTMTSGPLVELLNYCTGISFEGFAAAEKLNCSFYQSSFVEEKGYNFIKSVPKDYVKYNMRQLSRIYPQGSRFNSSNYMPQIYWNVGCQLVALNYQTSDLPMQLNWAKFEFNGATGYIQKPWVMVRELSKSSGGTFNPFIQSKLEDIVPAKLSLKIISGYFLTEKRTNCFVEAELYGLPSDTIRHKFYTKRMPAPHPVWKEDPFTFKRILLPELAMLRVAVFDEDKELVGQRFLPVNAIRPGFRHISLRTRHSEPLSLAMLFVYIKVEDWVPNELEDIVAMLMDPIQFASRAMEELAKGDDFEENDDDDDHKGNEAAPAGLGPSTTPGHKQPSPLLPKRALPNARKASAPDIGIPTQLPSSSASQSVGKKSATLGATAALGGFDDTLPSLEKAKMRQETRAVAHDSKLVVEHPKYLKVAREGTKRRISIIKKHEKVIKQQRSKQSKQKWGAEVAVQKAIEEIEAAHQAELLEHDRAAFAERHQTHMEVLREVHAKQMEELKKVHKNDVAQMNKELVNTMKKHRKNSDIADKKAGMRDIEDKTIRLGKKMRNEFEKIHSQELTKLQQLQDNIITELTELQKWERDELVNPPEAAGP